eukprot:CAMPEP_0118917976 /NCGR_PEP_ID=MMETSP1166-20130328/17638_1 /TAXON_ID=1104430 /ORGANISM="Chrysoreinhardia sp, Strain CCMP3193" /LENGTH=33 /DNA_ID= /DNA_START= /DNA_END= /DNA_ORIENTATION=
MRIFCEAGTGDIDGGARQIQSCQAVATPSDVTI